jgi:hypothetical protein
LLGCVAIRYELLGCDGGGDGATYELLGCVAIRYELLGCDGGGD